MSYIEPTTIKSGLSGAGGSPHHRFSMAQVGDVVIFANGYDPVQALMVRKMTMVEAGMAAPAAAPVVTAGVAGNVVGNVRYRVRWRENLSGMACMSTASAEAELNDLAGNVVTVAQPAGAPSRATHWIVERTNDGGDTFYPVNRTSTYPDGTPIGTNTFDDDVADESLPPVGFRNRQGIPPASMRFVFAHQNRVFGAGRDVHKIDVGFTHGSQTIVSTEGYFSQALVGMDVVLENAVDATDIASYKVESVASANTATLAETAGYLGVTGTHSAIFSAAGARIGWSELREPEHWGEYEVGGELSNSWLLGDAGEEVTSGCSIGQQGVVWAQKSRLWYHYFSDNPAPAMGQYSRGDGRIIPIAIRRGAVGPMAMKFIDGNVYGMDAQGIWMMAAGGEPREIGTPLHYDFIRGEAWGCDGDNWHIGYDALRGWVYFFITMYSESGDYPKRAFIWDTTRQRWIGSRTYTTGITCNTEMRDQNDALRLAIQQQAIPASDAPSRLWMDNIGLSRGAFGSAPLAGTITGVDRDNKTFTCTGGAWETDGDGLKGVPVTKVAKLDGARETQIIALNTADSITPGEWTTPPAIGDTFEIGGGEALYRTPRFDCGYSDRKKKFKQLRIKLKYKAACVPLLVKSYFDGSTTPNADQLALAEDGVTIEAGQAEVEIDPTERVYRFYVPLHNRIADDVFFDLYSHQAGSPWEIVGPIVLEYDLDQSTQPRKT